LNNFTFFGLYNELLSNLKNERSETYTKATFWTDLKVGIILFVSFLPTAMALGVASGMGALAGLWCGVFVGITAALFGGTRALVSGPSAVLVVIVATLIVDEQLTLPELAIIIVISGFFQLLLGLLGWGRFASYIPHIVLTGFMSGIGILLLWNQAQQLWLLGTYDLIVSGICLLMLFFWPNQLEKYLPSGFAVIVAGLILVIIFPEVTRIGPVSTNLPFIVFEVPDASFIANAIGPAVLIALISSTYTLMLSLISDSLTGSQHNPNRQLFGLGLGNIFSGLFGALPGSANVATITANRFGGKTVLAGIICQIIVVGVLLGFGRYVAALPLAALLAIVMFVGWNIINFSFLKKIPKMPPRYSMVMLLILFITVVVDPLFAIVFGVIAANFVNAMQLELLEHDNVLSVPLLDNVVNPDATDSLEARVGLLAFRGAFTVSSSRRLARMINYDISGHKVVIIDLTKTNYIDDSAGNLLSVVISQAKKNGIDLVVFGVNENIRKTLYTFDVLEKIPEQRMVNTMQEAKDLAWSLLKS